MRSDELIQFHVGWRWRTPGEISPPDWEPCRVQEPCKIPFIICQRGLSQSATSVNQQHQPISSLGWMPSLWKTGCRFIEHKQWIFTRIISVAVSLCKGTTSFIKGGETIKHYLTFSVSEWHFPVGKQMVLLTGVILADVSFVLTHLVGSPSSCSSWAALSALAEGSVLEMSCFPGVHHLHSMYLQ